MRSCGAEQAGLFGVSIADKVEELLLLSKGGCDGEEDSDIGGDGSFQNGR